MSFAVICPPATLDDANAILRHLGRCDADASAFTILLGDGSWAAHTWVSLWPDPMPAIPGYTTQQVADVVASVQITPATEVEARALFDAVLLNAGLAMAWVQPFGAGDDNLAGLGERRGHVGINWFSRRDFNTQEPGTFDSGWQPEGPGPFAWSYIGNEGWLGPVAVTNGGTTYDLGADVTDFREPGSVGAVWVERVSGPEAWAPDTNYLNGGEERTNGGETWINIRPNNTQQLQPGTTGSGWLRKTNRPAPYYDVGTPYYPVTLDGVAMRVTDAGNLWLNTVEGNSFAPGVFGWTNEGPAP